MTFPHSTWRTFFPTAVALLDLRRNGRVAMGSQPPRPPTFFEPFRKTPFDFRNPEIVQHGATLGPSRNIAALPFIES